MDVLPVTGRNLRNFWKTLLHYSYIKEARHHDRLGHNVLAGLTYIVTVVAAIVQIISGFGIQDMEALPEAERITMAIPESIKRRMEAEKDYMNSRLPGYLGKPDPSGEIQYDYKFFGTEVVSFDTKKSHGWSA